MKNWEVIKDNDIIDNHVDDVAQSLFQKISGWESKKIREIFKSSGADLGTTSIFDGGIYYGDSEMELRKRFEDIETFDSCNLTDYDDEESRTQYFFNVTIVKDNDDYFWVERRKYLFEAPDYYDLIDEIVVKCDQLRGLLDFFNNFNF